MDEQRTPVNLAGWLAQIAEYSPDLFAADGTPNETALRIAQSCEVFRDMDAASNWASIITTGSQIAQNAYTRDRAHGSVNPVRAGVDSLLRDYDRDPSPVARRVDPYEGQRHNVIRGRNKKGATAVVRHLPGRSGYGAATVQGRTDAVDPDDVRGAFASHLLSYVRSMPCGLNALNVTQVTDAVYGALLPSHAIGLRRDGSERHAVLIGTEVAAHSEVFDPYHPACFEPIAEHNQVTRVSLPRSGVEYGPVDERGPSYGPRRPAVIWQAHAHCSHTDDVLRAATFRDRPLQRVKARKSEATRLEPRRTLCIMRGVDPITGDLFTRDLSTTRSPLIAPDTREGKAWFGHRLAERGVKARRHATRDRARSERRVIVSRTLLAMTLSDEASTRVFLDDMQVGDQHRVRVNDTFVMQVSRRNGKFNCQIWHGAPVGQTGHVVWQGGLQVRSVATLARRITAAVTI